MSRVDLTLASLNLADLNDKLSYIADRLRYLDSQGTLALSGFETADDETANTVYAGPESGSPTTPAFRALVAADIPSLAASKITSGTLALARGGTNADLSATGGTNNLVKQASVGAALTVGTIAAAALSDYTEFSAFTPSRSAATGTWSGGADSTARYKIIGKSMWVQLYISGSTLSAGTATISFTIPASKTSANVTHRPCRVIDNGTAKVGIAATAGAGASVTIYPDVALGAWSASAGNCEVMIDMHFEIQ